MRIGLIDVDGHHFPNLPLMKLSAWHKGHGDRVEWYDPLTAWLDPPDLVYVSKVFSFTEDYPHPINAKKFCAVGQVISIRMADRNFQERLSISIQTTGCIQNSQKIQHTGF